MRYETEQNYLADDCECTDDLEVKGCMVFLMACFVAALAIAVAIYNFFQS